MDWQQIIIIVVPTLAAVSFLWFRVDLFLKALKEVADVLTVLVTALGDKNLTKEEIEAIKKEGLEALGAFKKLIGKKK